MIHITLVIIGGFFGAISRFSISNWIKGKYSTSFPIATLMVNLVGSFLLGLLIGGDFGHTWSLLLGTGFMGAFTTFSTFKLENIQFFVERNKKLLVVYLGVTYSIGIVLAFLGIKLGGYL